MPKKPSIPPSHIVFSKHGPPVPVAEPLPTDKEEVELVLVQKFLYALKERFGRVLSNPTRGSEWPDFWVSENGKRMGIELVEIVNPQHIREQGYGAKLPVSQEVARHLLIETIETKVAKNYRSSPDIPVWLVAVDLTGALA